MISKELLSALSRGDSEELATFYLPTHRYGPDVQGDPIRLKNLLSEAERRAEEADMPKRKWQQLFEPVAALLSDSRYWQHSADGLAVFASMHGCVVERLPVAVAEHVYLGRRYCVRPLLPALSEGDLFYVLAISQNSLRLVECTRTAGRELDLHDIPRELRNVVGYDFEEKSLQFHTGTAGAAAPGGRRRAMYHGQGRNSDKDKEEIGRFLRAIDDGLRVLLANRKAPLVIAAVDYIAAMFQEVSSYPNLVPRHLVGNPERLDAAELQARSLDLAAPVLDRGRDETAARVREMAHARQALAGIEPVLRAARAGRVERLLAWARDPVWGRHGETSGDVEVHAERHAGDDDLLDLAIATALQTGAEPFAVERGALPDHEPVAALLRY